MPPRAVLFGSIGVLAETSELQRGAFNAAFREAGLDWDWGPEEYARMLHTPGGLKRIESYNKQRGARIDAAELHAAKTHLFQKRLEEGVTLRPGVRQTIEALRAEGVPMAFCSTTDQGTVERLLAHADPALPSDVFAYVGHADIVERPKPAPDVYHDALRTLCVDASEAVAVEDSPENAAAAAEAGLRVVGFAGALHERRDMPAASRRIERMDPRALGFGFAPMALAAE